MLVPLIALAGLGLYYVALLNYDFRADQQLNHVDEIVASVEHLQNLVSQQNAVLRRFEIAPNDIPTTGMLDLQSEARTAFASLQKIAASDPEASRLLMQWNDQYQLWLGWAEATLAGHVYNATLAQNDQRGITLMDAVSDTTRSLLAHEHHLRDVQTAHLRRFKRHTSDSIAIIVIVIGLLLATYTRKSLRTVSLSYRAVIDKLNRSSSELEHSRNWFQTTLESIGDAVLTCDREANITFMNPAAERLTGWSAQEASGRSSHEIFRIFDEQTRKPLDNPAAKVALSASILSLSGQSLLVARDQSECVIQHNAAPIHDARGKTTGSVLVFRDVTDQLRTQQALQASEKLAVAGRLAAAIAHEIHNPLDSIANLHYLIDTEDDPEVKREHLALARQELARTILITRTMLSLYREADTPVLASLADLTRGVLLLLDRRIRDHAITLEESFEGDCIVEGFPAELRQVLTNVLVNAMEAAGDQGRVRIRIETEAAQELRASGVFIRVLDNGKGIAQGAGSRIFQPFFTTKGASGTGLGLWVSLGIIQKHGGNIRIFNSGDPDLPGACVEIFIPRFSHTLHPLQAAASAVQNISAPTNRIA